MKRAFIIKEVKPGIFLFQFNHHYDMCMYFLRYQEFYESPSPKYRGKSFTILDFMKWYSLKYGKGSFTYPDDWNGFNIPSNIIFDMWNQHLIPDKNIYDYEMYQGWKECNVRAQGKKFYIIGVVRGNKALSHEIAHGLFYLYPEYKKEMKRLVKSLEPALRKRINNSLKKLGYTPKVYVDETQAYMATGMSESFGDHNFWSKEQKLFESYFKKFVRTVK
jgi:hypothetical protein